MSAASPPIATTSPKVVALARHEIQKSAMSSSRFITFLSAVSISSNRVNCERKSTKWGRRLLGSWLLAGAFVAYLPAQENVALTRISTTASDAVFRVDGQPYQGAAVFSWPSGSKHTLEIADW